MYELNFNQMLKNADSENIHVWKKTKNGINSYKCEDEDEALQAYEVDNASLYTSSSARMRDEFCKQL